MAGRDARGRGARDARRRLQAFEVRQAVHADGRRRVRRDDRVAAVVLGAVLVLATASQVAWATVGPGAAAPAPTATAVPTATPTATPAPSSTSSGTASPDPSPTPAS